ncbi:PBP1A family penicillin-binding protein [Geovibrio thiophilus]|uniref:Penicillin-binding protein 1A n=1 Tax=Geovibrio thiophilus TaxID=139438 RepID=A0A3R5XWB7_9BACT|nr:PBP1A family penicillin-binding protein [Geovibrio thiophilus]QAR32716.1 PBP1A family penicillin-binding protein [Geovibrio thiophilus]
MIDTIKDFIRNARPMYLVIGAALFIMLFTFSSVLGYIYVLSRQLPSVEQLKDFQYDRPTIIYDRNGDPISELGTERRYPISINEMPEYMWQSVIAVEDARFFDHGGVDMMGIMRAFVSNVKAGRVVEGGSTLTQQLVKIIYLTPEKKLKRKIKEAILAYRLDNFLDKEQILEMYLNQVYFGRGAYGVEAAAANYFGKKASELTLAEAAMIAGIPKAPGIYAPHINMDKAVSRRNHVLYRLFETGYITEDAYKDAADDKVKIIDKIKPKNSYAGYFTDMVVRFIRDEFKDEEPENRGYKVYTTLDLDLQKNAETAVKNNILRLSKELGYAGVITVFEENRGEGAEERRARLDEILKEERQYILSMGFQRALVTKVEKNQAEILLADRSKGILRLNDNKWAKPRGGSYSRLTDFATIIKKNSVIYVSVLNKDNGYYEIEADPDLESALISMEPDTGAILAVTGGFEYSKSMFNRAVQAKRQVGSLFKPIVYSAALENGYDVMTETYDAPVVKAMDEEGEYWKPENYSGRFYGLTTLKEALTQSRNVVTIKIAEKIGIGTILSYAKKFGMTEHLARDLSISIGSGSAPLIEMVSAFSVFPNLGYRVQPYYVTKIEDGRGNLLKEYKPSGKTDVIKPETAQIMIELMENVVEQGTGKRARILHRPTGGKTGTTNDFKDAWFVGYLPNVVSGVWVGFDDFKVIGHSMAGASAALPAWVDYMNTSLRKFPYAVFPVSENVMYYKVDSGTHKITDSYATDFTFEPYDVTE